MWMQAESKSSGSSASTTKRRRSTKSFWPSRPTPQSHDSGHRPCESRNQFNRGVEMDYVNFGHTGMKVSRICLGCMTYGRPPAPFEPKAGRHLWALNEEASQTFLRQALVFVINPSDT